MSNPCLERGGRTRNSRAWTDETHESKVRTRNTPNTSSRALLLGSDLWNIKGVTASVASPWPFRGRNLILSFRSLFRKPMNSKILIEAPVTPLLAITLEQSCYFALLFHTLLISRLRGKERMEDPPYKRLEILQLICDTDFFPLAVTVLYRQMCVVYVNLKWQSYIMQAWVTSGLFPAKGEPEKFACMLRLKQFKNVFIYLYCLGICLLIAFVFRNEDKVLRSNFNCW
jgi:hypothetical protein